MANNNAGLTLDDLDQPEINPINTGAGETLQSIEDGETAEEEEEEEEEVKKSATDPEPEEDPDPEKGAGDEEEEEENEQEETFDTETYFEELSTELGVNVNDLEIDFEGEDPLTPKGITKVINAVKDREIENFDAHLKAEYPEAYAHLLALQGGSTTEEFIKSIDGSIDLIPSAERLAESVEVQRELVRQDLLSKGVTKEAVLKSVLEGFEEDDELLAEALKVREGKVATRDQRMQELEAQASERVQAEKVLIDKVDQDLAGILSTGTVAQGITIPKAERLGAIQEFRKNLRVENGKIVHVKEVSVDDIKSAFGKDYISGKKNIDSIVEKKAKTVNANRLRLSVETEKKNKSQASKGKGGYTTLGEIDND